MNKLDKIENNIISINTNDKNLNKECIQVLDNFAIKKNKNEKENQHYLHV